MRRMRVRFWAKEGDPFVAAAAVLAVGAGAAFGLVGWALGVAALAFMLNFFRDPERAPEGAGLLAPADGKVVRAEPGRVDIFMNVFDVHVNRAPISGRVERLRYQPGRFLNAAKDEASAANERVELAIRTDDGQAVELALIAGLLARRIVPYCAAGDRVRRGERIGMIRFGSRVDCRFP
ncbi:MAG: phosphatidylserine decarboxylase, partial [Zetaproteobacteria bacterium]